MITGANTNVRYRGVVFHVQTEDSGRANPHIISHLYHGGTILASEKTEYADRMQAEDLEGEVRELIETQHKAMLRSLKQGAFDQVIAERLGDTAIQSADSGPETPTPMPTDEAPPVRPTAAPPRPSAAAPRVGKARTFGDGIVSQKPLDEVILEYLADKAQDRAERSARKPR